MQGGWALPPTDAHLNSISIEYTYQDLEESTDRFIGSNKLGSGTYGSVYRGVLRDGTEVAIKVLAQPKEQGFREEVEVLSKFRHPNLVILMGFARHNKERYLVYELLSGGDVCSRLQGTKEYEWQHRLGTSLDAALGLSHLHFSRPQVFHRDIKTQNILLDKNGTGKMADFGLACLAQPDCEALRVEHTSGTIGYADPLYIHTSVVTEKSEVYSFGMVMLELLTGRPPALQHPTGRVEYQFGHICGDIRNVYPMVDVRARWPQRTIEQFGTFALRCIHESEAQRPNFREIVETLRRWFREAENARAAEPPRRPSHPSVGPGGAPGGAPGGHQVGNQGYGGGGGGGGGGGMPGHNPFQPGPSPMDFQNPAAADARGRPGPGGNVFGQPVQVGDRGFGGGSKERSGATPDRFNASPQPAVRPAAPGPSPVDPQPQHGVPRPGWQQVNFQPAGQSRREPDPVQIPFPRPAANQGPNVHPWDRPQDANRQVHAFQQGPPVQTPAEPAPGAQGGAQGGAPDPRIQADADGFDMAELQRALKESEEAANQQPAAPKGPEESTVAAVMDMGFTREQALAGLRRCSTAEAAVEWIIEQGVE